MHKEDAEAFKYGVQMRCTALREITVAVQDHSKPNPAFLEFFLSVITNVEEYLIGRLDAIITEESKKKTGP